MKKIRNWRQATIEFAMAVQLAPETTEFRERRLRADVAV